MNHLTTSIVQSSVPGVTTRAWMTASTLRLMLPTDDFFAQEVPEPIYDGLTCPKYALWDSNPGSWLAKEQKSRFRFGGRRYCS